MNEKKSRMAKSVLIAATLATIFWVSAGDLNPPAGPIAPTQRTPIGASTTPGDADSLFKITQPESYYLTGNITGVSGKSGIEIAAYGVNLDLMGFDLLGVADSFAGVRVSVTATSVAVINGSVRSWAQDGVDLASANNTRLTDLRVSGNGANGIRTGINAIVTGCAAFQNGVGISTGAGCTITNCAATLNGSGIFADDGSTITNCLARFNQGDGIEISANSTVRGNTCGGNGFGGDGAGIHATGTDNRIEGNNCTRNDRGIDVDAGGNFITRNTCSGNDINWDVATGNVCLVVSAATSAAIVGNSGGVAPGSTDPNANFTY